MICGSINSSREISFLSESISFSNGITSIGGVSSLGRKRIAPMTTEDTNKNPQTQIKNLFVTYFIFDFFDFVI